MEKDVQEAGADIFVGAMMAVFGVIGLILAGGARDSEMLIFGASLAGFAVLFDAGLVKRLRAARVDVGKTVGTTLGKAVGKTGGRAP